MGDTEILFSVSSLLCSQSPSFPLCFPGGNTLHLHHNRSAMGLCQTLCRMRRWLQGESGVGTVTDDLLFPSGKAEWRSVGRWRGLVVSPSM